MSFQALYAKNHRLYRDSAVWRILRSDHAAATLSFLEDLFAGKHEVSVSEARVALDAERRRMRDIGVGEWQSDTPTSTYLNRWMNKDDMLIEREGQLTKSDALEAAIRFVQTLDTRSVGTSASHLRVVQETVRDFAAAISPNIEDRLEIAKRKRDEINREIMALEAGEVHRLTELQEREGIREIFNLAHILPADFRLVEQEVRQRDVALRTNMLKTEMTQGQLLMEAMDQEDLLSQTEAGGAFEGFYTLLCDDARNMEFRAHLKSILDQPVSRHLTASQHKYLSKLMRELTRESERVFKVRARTAEALRAYIDSGSAVENRVMGKIIEDVEKLALKLRELEVNPKSPTSIKLNVSGLKVASPQGIVLLQPSHKIDTTKIKTAVNKNDVSDAALKALDSVNIRAIAKDILEILKDKGAMTVSDVASHLPIRSGLEELVAYVRVARAIKSARLTGTEQVPFMDAEGVRLKAKIPVLLMSAELFSEQIESLEL